jgi:nucleoside-diphosphate-sugar epimerase
MNILIFGGAGMLGSAVAHALRSRGHEVRTAGRSQCDLSIDFRAEHSVNRFRDLVRGVDVVVNCVGILIERGQDRFAAVHAAAPAALFEACAAEHVARVVQVSAMGAERGINTRYMRSKEAAERALKTAFAHSSSDWVIVRPSLLMDATSPATRLFSALASMPIIGLPGFLQPGAARLAPLSCSDVAQAIAQMCEHHQALHRVIELGGQEISYREFLSQLRQLQGRGAALWLPVPWWLMHLTARAAEWFPQKVFSSEGLQVLKSGITSTNSETARWLGHVPRMQAAWLQPTQPVPPTPQTDPRPT